MDGPARRNLGPLLGGLALAVVVGGVAMAVALHGRSTAEKPAPPTPTPGASSPRPSPSPRPVALDPMPLPSGATAVAAWDSTHLELLAYSPSDSESVAGSVLTWDGTWHRHAVAAGSPSIGGTLIDTPELHGVLLVTAQGRPPFAAGATNVWLWDGTAWRPMGAAPFAQCQAPSSGVFDPVDNLVLVVTSDQCVNDSAPRSETWAFDGEAWQGRGVAPDGVMWPALAWEADTNRPVMLQAPPAGDPAGNREWAWTARDWVLAGSLRDPLAPPQLAGAGWDADAGGVVAVPATGSGRRLAYVVDRGTWKLLPSATFPQRVMSVAADPAGKRVLVLGQRPIAVSGTPDPAATGYFVLTWDGHDWVAT